MASMRAMMQSVSLQEQYDENAKWLISQKPFLANILVRTVKEFEGLDPKGVEKLIEGNPSVGATPVEEGLTNEKREDGTTEISGMNTEKKVHNEGVVYFDVLFYVRMHQDLAKVIVNIELQKKEPTLYDIEMRGIFYAAREISSQLDREFKIPHYNNIKKVYSIWICMNARENSLNKIILKKEDIIGYSRWKECYSVLNLVIIRLGRKVTEDQNQELHRFLGTIFGRDLQLSEKEAILEKEFGIDLDNEKKERLVEMCNLGEGIWETALEQGIEQGIEQGKISGIIETCRKLNLSEAEIVEKIKEIMHISEDEAKWSVQSFEIHNS